VAIEIKIDLARVSAEPPLMALADVTLRFSEGELTIRRCAVFEKTGEPPWATLPRIPVEKNGKKIYAPMVELGRELRQRVLNAVLDTYKGQPL
jgi:hypothetical protein